jgi:hypothetical protein
VAARSFPQPDPDDAWLPLLHFLQEKLKDEPELIDSLHLVVRRFDQIKEGGIYAIGPGYTEINDLLAPEEVGASR